MNMDELNALVDTFAVPALSEMARPDVGVYLMGVSDCEGVRHRRFMSNMVGDDGRIGTAHRLAVIEIMGALADGEHAVPAT